MIEYRFVSTVFETMYHILIEVAHFVIGQVSQSLQPKGLFIGTIPVHDQPSDRMGGGLIGGHLIGEERRLQREEHRDEECGGDRERDEHLDQAECPSWPPCSCDPGHWFDAPSV